tara:strand:- start:4723 stop:5310 length:588 start_codon:yes stop_codon:yes gene_type:complete
MVKNKSELDWLAIVAKQHDEWIKIINGFGEYDYAEDLVQEFYITLHKYANKEKIIRNDVVSRGYCFFTLRSLYYQYYNNKKKINKFSIDDLEFTYQIADDSQMDEQIAFHKICTMIDEKLNSLHWYDKKLFTIYKDTHLSIRKLAAETKISWVSIFNTLKHIKQEIKEEYLEDWQDYKNKDYELINKRYGKKRKK